MENGKWQMAEGRAIAALHLSICHLPFTICHLSSMQIDHINLVVEDLEKMTAFYVDVLGLKITKRATITGEWISRVVGLNDAHGDVVYLDFPSGPRIELIKYNRPALHRPPNV